MVPAILSWTFAAVLVLGQAPAANTPTPAEIAAAIERLGDDSFAVREQATEELWQFGEAAEPALRAALKNADAEIRVRAAVVLERFDSGLYPDTPPEAAALIRRYRTGNQGQKRQVIELLKTQKDWRTLTRLLKGETDDTLRNQLVNALRGEMLKKIAASIEEGDLAEVERLLRFDASSNDPLTQRQLATVYLLRGTLEERIAELKSEPDAAENPDKQRLLLVLYEAAGQRHQASALSAKLAAAAGGDSLHSAVQRHDWPEAARRYEEVIAKAEPRFETLAYAAMYHRLAGNAEKAKQRLDEANALAKPQQAWLAQELLLLHERIDEALEGLKKTRPTMAFEILCVRQEFDKAFAIADIEPGQTYDDAWFEALPPGDVAEADAIQQLNRRHILALQGAFFLHQLGEKQDAEAIFKYLRSLGKSAADSSAQWRRSELCRIQARLGLQDQAFADGAEFIETRGVTGIIPNLFGRQGAAAAHWYAFLSMHDPEPSAVERLQTVRRLLRPTPEQKHEEDWKPLVEAALAALPAEKGPSRFQRAEAVVEVYLAQGKRQEAIDLLSREDMSAVLYLRGGDLLRDDERFEEAAALYQRIDSEEAQRALALYLRGVCLEAAGRKDEARKLKDQAILLSIDNSARSLLFMGLASRQLPAEADAIRKLWIRTSPDLNAALAKEYADSAAPSDPATAAEFWEHVLLRLTSTSASLTEDAGYIVLLHAIHRAKAKAALAQGDKDSYQRELAACLHILPTDWGLLDDLVPKLDKAGWKDEADRLFKAQLAHLEALAKKYPESARFSNAIAWVSATTGRNLDEALTRAKRTMELAPDNPSYLDTLAEVHHARGDHAEAVAVQRRVVELSPTPLFRERLAKFEAAAQADK